MQNNEFYLYIIFAIFWLFLTYWIFQIRVYNNMLMIKSKNSNVNDHFFATSIFLNFVYFYFFQNLGINNSSAEMIFGCALFFALFCIKNHHFFSLFDKILGKNVFMKIDSKLFDTFNFLLFIIFKLSFLLKISITEKNVLHFSKKITFFLIFMSLLFFLLKKLIENVWLFFCFFNIFDYYFN